MTASQRLGEETARKIRAFLATYNSRDEADRQVALRIRERLHSDQYRRERELYREWVDHGGESG